MDIRLLWRIVRFAFTTAYLMVGWLVFTCNMEWFSVFLGLVLSMMVALVTYDLFIDIGETEKRALIPRAYLLAYYLLILAKNIVWSSVKMIPLLFTLDMKPRIVHLRTRLRTDIGRVMLANSITLTPGTLTIDLSGDNLLVHWLDAKTTHRRAAGEMIKGDLERWLRRIWS